MKFLHEGAWSNFVLPSRLSWFNLIFQPSACFFQRYSSRIHFKSNLRILRRCELECEDLKYMIRDFCSFQWKGTSLLDSLWNWGNLVFTIFRKLWKLIWKRRSIVLIRVRGSSLGTADCLFYKVYSGCILTAAGALMIL